MWVDAVWLRDFRNHARLDVTLAREVSVVVGPVGSGKTNLLEAVYFGCTGRSFRTANERELVRFGRNVVRVQLGLQGAERRHELAVSLRLRPRAKRLQLDGNSIAGIAEVEQRARVCVFVPDRLDLVKGAAGLRRAHLDAFVEGLWPTRHATRRRYASVLAQRNALIGRVRAGVAAADQLRAWDTELAQVGIELIQARAQALELLAPRFAARAGELGLPSAAMLEYRPTSLVGTVEELEADLVAARSTDLARGFTTRGPHRDDVRILAAERDLRRFGSQGQQRLAFLSLLLAERDVLNERSGAQPLLLLDDVLSELDAERRGCLVSAVRGQGQTLVTTADDAAVEALGEDVTRIEVGDVAASPEGSQRRAA